MLNFWSYSRIRTPTFLYHIPDRVVKSEYFLARWSFRPPPIGDIHDEPVFENAVLEWCTVSNIW